MLEQDNTNDPAPSGTRPPIHTNSTRANTLERRDRSTTRLQKVAVAAASTMLDQQTYQIDHKGASFTSAVAPTREEAMVSRNLISKLFLKLLLIHPSRVWFVGWEGEPPETTPANGGAKGGQFRFFPSAREERGGLRRSNAM